MPIGQGIAGSVAASGETINIEDAYADKRFNQEVDRRTGYRTRSILCAPVVDAGGRVVAVLQILNRLDGEPFDDDDERLLGSFVGQIAIALRNAQQMEQIEERRQTSELLLDVMKSFSSELEVDSLLRKIMERTSAVLQADRSTLFLVDRRTNEIWSKVAQGAGMVEIRVPIGRASPGRWPPPERRSTSPTRMPMPASTPRWTGAPVTARGPSCARRSGTARARWSASPRCSTRPPARSPATTRSS